jgi:heterodisulfide reductase subunit A-like polyferredoxin
MNQVKSQLSSGAPSKELHRAWKEQLESYKKLNSNQANDYKIIVVGTGLAGASASATLAEMGFNVKAFSYHESPRRRTVLQRRGGSMLQKTIRKMVTAQCAFFMTPLKAVILDQEKKMCIGWQKLVKIL